MIRFLIKLFEDSVRLQTELQHQGIYWYPCASHLCPFIYYVDPEREQCLKKNSTNQSGS